MIVVARKGIKQVTINTLEELYKYYPDDSVEVMTTIQWPLWLERMVDFERKATRIPRSTWLKIAVLEKLERMGYDVNKKMGK